MFTGFPTENTPALQIWDYFRTSSGTPNSLSLTNDCAPIQIFRTGAGTTAISVYLPSSPIEGKLIKIINQRYGSSTSAQIVNIFSSDTSGNGNATVIYPVGPGGVLDLIFVKNEYSYGVSNGLAQSGWVSLNQGTVSSVNFNSISLGGASAVSPKSTAIGFNSNNSAAIATGSGSVSLGGSNAAGIDAFAAAISSTSTAYGAVGSATVAIGSLNSAQGNFSSVVGGDSNTATGTYASVTGGSSNTASATYNSIMGGFTNVANASYAAVAGGRNNTASGDTSFVCGYANTASGYRSTVLGGSINNTASGDWSTTIGGGYGTTRGIIGNQTSPASFPITSTVGATQSSLLHLGKQTTNNTTTRITSDGFTASTTNQVILPNNSAYVFEGTVIANVTGGGNTSGWKFEGVIKRGANAASTTLVGFVTPSVISQDGGAATWAVSVTADTTNGGIAVDVTGAAATTIRWLCRIVTTEVTF